MNVQITAVTQPLIKTADGARYLTADEYIVYAARASNPSNQLNIETGPKLLAHCMRNKHWSVFQKAYMDVEIKTSRAIAAQILRHKSFDFQEFSQRYAEVTETEPIEIRAQAKSNRQSSTLDIGATVLDSTEKGDLTIDDVVAVMVADAKQGYEILLKAGAAKECARMILPLASQTTIYMGGNLRSWLHYFLVRNDHHAQKEHRLIAQEIERIFAIQFPNIYAAFKDYAFQEAVRAQIRVVFWNGQTDIVPKEGQPNPKGLHIHHNDLHFLWGRYGIGKAGSISSGGWLMYFGEDIIEYGHGYDKLFPADRL